MCDMNLEREAKNAVCIRVSLAKRLALVQAKFWAERGEAGDICELDPAERGGSVHSLLSGSW